MLATTGSAHIHGVNEHVCVSCERQNEHACTFTAFEAFFPPDVVDEVEVLRSLSATLASGPPPLPAEGATTSSAIASEGGTALSEDADDATDADACRGTRTEGCARPTAAGRGGIRGGGKS